MTTFGRNFVVFAPGNFPSTTSPGLSIPLLLLRVIVLRPGVFFVQALPGCPPQVLLVFLGPFVAFVRRLFRSVTRLQEQREVAHRPELLQRPGRMIPRSTFHRLPAAQK